MKRISLFVLAFFLFADGYTQVTGGKEKTGQEQTYQQKGYTINYAENWELNNSSQMGTEFILFSRLEGSGDVFRENVNLIVQDLPAKGMSLADYTALSEAQIKTLITHSKLLSSKRIKSGSREYQRLEYTGQQGVYSLHFVQYYQIQHNKAYVLTFTAEQNQFTRYREEAEMMLQSFQVK